MAIKDFFADFTSAYSSPPVSARNTLGAPAITHVDNSTLNTLGKLLEEERKATSSLNAFQKEQNRIAMDFNASQAELNRVFQQQSAERAMQFSSDEAQKNRDWQKMMSDTAYTRVVQDLKNAGLNPILAVSQGSASTPSGSSASGFSSSGSAASGVTSSGSKTDYASILSTVLNYSLGLTANSAKLLGAIGSIIPF